MRLDALWVQNMRNIREAELTCDPELTVIAGPNGQGKTNLLECIWLLTGAKSFRGAKDAELIRRGEDFGRVVADAEANGDTNHIELLVAGPDTGRRGRKAKVNGVEYGRATSIAGTFTAVVFEPGHLSLVKGGPEGRRRFVDAALCQLYPGYVSTLRRYSRALTQKNALLKNYHLTPAADEMLDAFDAELLQAGSEMMRRRAAYLAVAGKAAQQFYAELSQGAEALCIQYLPCCGQQELADKLREARSIDIRAGFSTFGPHREDFDAAIDESSARIYGSQGQQRSVVLSLKLAEAQTAEEIAGEHPLMLLDDVLSELDESRQQYLLSRMGGKQCFVTTCDASAFGRTAGRVVMVKDGATQPAQD